MELKWTSKAQEDLSRLYKLLAPVKMPAGERAVQALVNAPEILLINPSVGEQLLQCEPCEVRRIRVGQ